MLSTISTRLKENTFAVQTQPLYHFQWIRGKLQNRMRENSIENDDEMKTKLYRVRKSLTVKKKSPVRYF